LAVNAAVFLGLVCGIPLKQVRRFSTRL